jgi:hypothetical protein
MRLDRTGPQLAQVDIEALEREYGGSLPSSYKGFLLQFNGGVPAPNVAVQVSGLPGSPTDLQEFFGIRAEVESSDLYWNLRSFGKACVGRRLLPIACDSGGSLFCLRTVDDGSFGVILLDAQTGWDDLFDVAPDFETFLAMLQAV